MRRARTRWPPPTRTRFMARPGPRSAGYWIRSPARNRTCSSKQPALVIHMNSSAIDRRSFLKTAAASLAAPAFLRNLISAPPSSTVRLASFGAGGMAFYTLDGIATHPKVKLVCVAEVDSDRLDQATKKYPDV